MKVGELIQKLNEFDKEIEIALICKEQQFDEVAQITPYFIVSEQLDINGNKFLLIEEGFDYES